MKPHTQVPDTPWQCIAHTVTSFPLCRHLNLALGPGDGTPFAVKNDMEYQIWLYFALTSKL